MASPGESRDPPSSTSDAHSYYNNPQEHGLQRRNESKILHLRNFNNWIKSTLIDQYLKQIRRQLPEREKSIRVFDMGCGKGGDQLKWDIGRVKHVTFSDLAENSVTVCEERFNSRRCRYTADFVTLDSTKDLLREEPKFKQEEFDLVSSQFVLHYAFDEIKSAHRFLRNIAEFLRVGGYFIGTTVNACQLVKRCRESADQSISNEVFSIKFDPSIDLKATDTKLIPLFGAKYHFSLDEVVDCPEYLVYFPLLEKLAEKHGLKRVLRETFEDYFNRHVHDRDSAQLLRRMKALERYDTSMGERRGADFDPKQYEHAEKHMASKPQSGDSQSCGTLSKQEWEMTSLYIVFAFEKVREVKYNEHDQEEPSSSRTSESV